MRVLGIDPGSHNLGWGVVDCVGSKMTHVASGTLRAPAGTLPARLVHLHAGLSDALRVHKPEVAAIETMFHAKNTQTVFVLAQARGAILLTLAQAGLAIFEYAPSEIKRAATGRGNSDKGMVQRMVIALLNLGGRAAMREDETDALACALCHTQHAPTFARGLVG